VQTRINTRHIYSLKEMVEMTAFIVLVNGKKVCSIALEPENGRSIDLVWGGNAEDALFLHVGGMDGDDYHVRWEVPKVRIGDEITIRIADADTGDPPTVRKKVEELNKEQKTSATPKADK
jgi:hypothetical protein